MDIKGNVAELRILLDRLPDIDVGYPLGVNKIHPHAQDAELPSAACEKIKCLNARKELTSFYGYCDGFSLPDVHVGYFVKQAEKLAPDRSSDPDVLLLEERIAILSVGTTGGGDIFAMNCDSGEVYLLPPGPVHNGQYIGEGRSVRTIANSLEVFIDRITSDVRAFVVGDAKHSYIA